MFLPCARHCARRGGIVSPVSLMWKSCLGRRMFLSTHPAALPRSLFRHHHVDSMSSVSSEIRLAQLIRWALPWLWHFCQYGLGYHGPVSGQHGLRLSLVVQLWSGSYPLLASVSSSAKQEWWCLVGEWWRNQTSLFFTKKPQRKCHGDFSVPKTLFRNLLRSACDCMQVHWRCVPGSNPAWPLLPPWSPPLPAEGSDVHIMGMFFRNCLGLSAGPVDLLTL